MDPYLLPTSLIVSPEISFARLVGALAALGWRRNDVGPSAPPLMAGEPELAGFHLRSGRPFLTYTFNPVVRLRVLDVGIVPPVERAAIAGALPLTGAHDVTGLLSAREPRDRLRGLWIARETERLDLMMQVQALTSNHVPAVAEVAREVQAKLNRVYESRLEALSGFRLLADAATTLIRQLGDPTVVRGLCASAADCDRLFDASVASHVAEAIAAWWTDPPRASPGDRYTDLEVTALSAGLLRGPNELSDQFPRGYRDIAGLMEPSHVWLTWTWTTAGDAAAGVRYDGLAWIGDRWVWLPKVFRAVLPRVH